MAETWWWETEAGRRAVWDTMFPPEGRAAAHGLGLGNPIPVLPGAVDGIPGVVHATPPPVGRNSVGGAPSRGGPQDNAKRALTSAVLVVESERDPSRAYAARQSVRQLLDAQPRWDDAGDGYATWDQLAGRLSAVGERTLNTGKVTTSGQQVKAWSPPDPFVSAGVDLRNFAAERASAAGNAVGGAVSDVGRTASEKISSALGKVRDVVDDAQAVADGLTDTPAWIMPALIALGVVVVVVLVVK